ncbi:ubiquinone/menaquinone biosynthesis C-methylase UbiE [Loktanella ponticola]|uniref:Ubiquinone/menaquinone biosynthesis C-methylase UbiE n=1 Tax=Yoonia ponticola TaxID=1524255 RepID=A0A7W9BKK2_9RHOB|nr:class I SAM-dependent methyltransferase [Yoonia ponticola]MBB5722256.1 ubiquinone/menaquinone biosynthesis C-methylase UbiE [Yoonia ponticola]
MEAEPVKPDQFLAWLSALPLHKETSVECGAGHAEIAQFLASRYATSYAVDLDPIPLPSDTAVKAISADAADLPFDDASVDLVVSMQALHHFDIAKHLNEARRILRPGGVFAALCWGEMSLPADVRRAYDPILDAIAPYWEDQRPFALSGYDGLAFSGVSIPRPQAFKRAKCNLDRLEGIMATWSAVQGAVKDSVDLPEPDLSKLTMDEEAEFDVSWPLVGQIFRVPA